MTTSDEKESWRRQVIDRLMQLDDAQAVASSKQVCQGVVKVLETVSFQSILLYRPRVEPREVMLHELEVYLHRHGALVDYAPLGKQAPLLSKQYDVIVVPLLGYDAAKFRLGNGGGWYDRLLARQSSALKIGVGFAVGQLENLPHEAHDVPMDIIVSDMLVLR